MSLNLIDEIKNPFTNGKVVSKDTDGKSYHRQMHDRGDPEFVMSRGQLMLFYTCPRRWKDGYKNDKTDEMTWGDLIDCLVLEPNTFKERFAVCPTHYHDKTGKRFRWDFRAKYCSEWRLEREINGATVIKNDQFVEAEKAVEHLLKNDLIHELIEKSDHQVYVTAEYHDPETKIVVPVKVLIDMVPWINTLNEKELADLKTASSCGERAFVRHVHDFNLHVQAAMYLDVYTAATREDRVGWLLPVQENYPPYHVEARQLSDEFIQLGRLKYITALKCYCRCLYTNLWPGYDCKQIIKGWGLVEPESWMVGA